MSAAADRPILLVEADRTAGEQLARLLAGDGYRVELARTARHARALAEESSPRLAVLGALMGRQSRRSACSPRSARWEDPAAGWDPQLPALVLGRAGGCQYDALRAFEGRSRRLPCRARRLPGAACTDRSRPAARPSATTACADARGPRGCESTSPRARRISTAGHCSCGGWSTTCWSISPVSRGGSSPATSFSGTSGVTGRRR